MKNLFVLIIFIASAVFISCNSDDDNDVNETRIIGKWEFFETALQLADEEFLPYYEVFGHIECGKDFIIFNSDNSAQNVLFKKGNSNNCYADESNFQYTISVENVELIYEEITISVKIEFLTNDLLKIIFLEPVLFETSENNPVIVDGFILKRV
ncbi:hypothetical protein [Aequorivita sinensis]|uniref:hypothetical protein n=1 Tax=Aequorivita sinensis TaxID=1382458 RepID=UPI002300D497|nr:hypothetical protein [Aequorivita sinensis]